MTDSIFKGIAQAQIKQSTRDIVYETLREAILSGDLVSGTQLKEAQLAKEFGVSKTPIREALQQLVHHGLADSELAKGVVVHSLTQAEIQDVVEMRLVLEPLAVTQSIPHLTSQDVDTLENTLIEAKDAAEHADYQTLSRLNSEFHRGLYQKATNQLLLQWLESLSDKRRLITMQGWRVDNRSQHEWDEHHAIFIAAKAQKAERASELLTQHIRGFAEIVFRDS